MECSYTSYESMKEYFERFACYNEDGDNIAFYNANKQEIEFITDKQRKSRFANCFDHINVNKDDTPTLFINNWMKDIHRKTAHKINCIPYSGTFKLDRWCSNGVINTFRGFNKLIDTVNESYRDEFNDFFENYFREGSQYMKKYFDEYRSWYNVIEKEHNRVSGSVYAGYGSIEDVFPLRLMDRWEGYVDQAKQEIEYLKDINPDLYQKLYERMDLEALFFDSVRLFWYETSYSDGQLLQMRLSFKERCEKYQLTHFSEGKTLASTYANWGI